MVDRPYVLLSVAMSIDGYIDDATDERLMLSNDADFDRVDEVRAGVDAILVGANTIRRDDPRLLVRSEDRRTRGPGSPIKVTVTGTGDLDPGMRFFTAGEVGKLVYGASRSLAKTRERLDGVATVVDAGDPIDLNVLLADLSARGVRRLMVEGGSAVLTQFITAGLVDELHLVIAPFFVGDPSAPRFVGSGAFPRMRLTDVQQIGDVVLLRYLADHDRDWLRRAIELSRSCPPSPTAFSVGAIIIDDSNQVIATGYSRETHPYDHAEEAAIGKVAADDPRLASATIYTSLEPCSHRASRPRSCTELILAAGIPRVVLAWREPNLFVDGQGVELLQAAGTQVIELPDLAHDVIAINAHLLDQPAVGPE